MKVNFQKLVVLLLTSLLFIGCTENLLPKYGDRQIHQAPQNANEVGVITTHAQPEDIAYLMNKHPSASFRVINSKHGLYEIHGVLESNINEALPDLNTMNNQFITADMINNQPILDISSIEKFAELNSFEPSKLNPCVEAHKAPNAHLLINNREPQKERKTILLGETLQLDGSLSVAHKDVGSDVQVTFAIQPPVNSQMGEKLLSSPTFQLKPDAYGLYKVLMIAQDKYNVCAYKKVAITVTGNPELTRSTVEGAAKSLSPFKHLIEVQAEESWEVSTGIGQLIAIIDTGVHYNHPDLNTNIYYNDKEIIGNGLDDDGNGFIDDAFGYDFINADTFPYDDVGHGTHVAGLAAASTFGLAKDARILPVKAIGPSGGDLGSILGAILYSVDSGANILNMSLGTYRQSPHPELVKVINYAESKGVLIIAASGNGHPQLGIGMNIDKVPCYPSALPNDNIVSVAAKDSTNLLAPYSNYGLVSVDVTAPGGIEPHDLVISSYYENPSDISYQGLAGTSMASPIVAGVAAQVWALNPSLSTVGVKNILLNSGLKVEGLDTRTVSGRYLNALEAVNSAKLELPSGSAP